MKYRWSDMFMGSSMIEKADRIFGSIWWGHQCGVG